MFPMVVTILGFLAFLLGLYPGFTHSRVFENEEVSLDPPRAVRRLGERVAQAKRSIRLASGELTPLVFDWVAPLIDTMLARNPKLTVTIVASPTIFTRRQANQRHANQLHELWRSGKYSDRFSILFLQERLPVHFCLIDQNFLYVEAPHEKPDFIRRLVYYDNSELWYAEYDRQFYSFVTKDPKIDAEDVDIVSHPYENTEDFRRFERQIESEHEENLARWLELLPA